MSAIRSLFQALKGLSSGLSLTEKVDGQMLLTTDAENSNKLYFDYEENGQLKRGLVNPNPDWNANSGNAQILNKPAMVTGVTIANNRLVVNRSDDGANSPASYSLNLTETSTVANGQFVKAGIICWFAMNSYELSSLAAGGSLKIADIPSGFWPTMKTSKAALVDSPRLSDSLVIEFDPVAKAVNVKNLSIDAAENFILLATTYEFISDTRSGD